MLHDDPRRRVPAEAALCSPFFSVPFGESRAALGVSWAPGRQMSVRTSSGPRLPCPVRIGLSGELAPDSVVPTPTAPHIEDLVMLPTPVLRLLNVLDGDYLESEEGYEGQCCPSGPQRLPCTPCRPPRHAPP